MKLWVYNAGWYGFIVRAPDREAAARILSADYVRLKEDEVIPLLKELTAEGEPGLVEEWHE